ncbi:MAG: hypothetical protein CUN56_02035 [Phototrophicales bacterium]|nr:MAG: hypothetical protein CUN56_02035 [Phototrophicales bacterium]RMG71542.1 MAG: hypothetical protein D6711_15225 [Chloroflexota bacterium]
MTEDIKDPNESGKDNKKGGLFGRGKANTTEKATKKPKKKSSTGNGEQSFIQRAKQWLIDSYNGIFKIVIEPQLPRYRVLGWMVLSFLFGMIWAYVVFPVSFYNGAPHQMSKSAQKIWVEMAAGSYYGAGRIYDADAVRGVLAYVDDPEALINEIIAERSSQEATAGPTNIVPALQALQQLDNLPEGRNSPSSRGLFTSLFQFVISVILFIAISWIVAIAWGLLIGGYVERFWERIRPKSEEDLKRIEDDKKRKEEMERRRQAQAEMERRAAAEAATMGPPLMSKPSIYTKGRAFDDSHAIEDADDMFLGECGATVAKTIGDGNDMTAVEVWLFDKDDFVKTLNKIFASPHAYNDPVLRASLEDMVDDPANDIVMIQPDASLEIETNNLRLKATIFDIKPGSNSALPANSHYDELTIQLQAWEKKGDGVKTASPAKAPAAAGLPDLSSYEIGPPPELPKKPAAPPPGARPLDEYEIGPPPDLPPAKKPLSSSGARPLEEYEIGPPPDLPAGMKPLTPPPMGKPPAEKEDDDPFGGTADFTPIGG